MQETNGERDERQDFFASAILAAHREPSGGFYIVATWRRLRASMAPLQMTSIASGPDLAHLPLRVAAGGCAALRPLYRRTHAKRHEAIARIAARSYSPGRFLQEVCARLRRKAGDFDPARGSPMASTARIGRHRAPSAAPAFARRLFPAGP